MTKRLSQLYTLTPEQQEASAPRELAWLSASAGTGKTQVLTARVMRLLLFGIDPASILCLTFTKAGAAEMADRIHERLAYWVRLKGPKLALELQALGEDYGPEEQAEARKLFASVLDARGGGLRIQTIHSFSQSLLAAFPAEADMTPGFKALEGREEAQLARETLAATLVTAEETGDAQLIADVQALSLRLGEEGAEAFLLRCAKQPEALAQLGAPELIEDELRRGFSVPVGDIEELIAEWCSDDIFPVAALRQVRAAQKEWGTAKTGLPNATYIGRWLASDASARAARLEELREIWCTKAGAMRKFTGRLLDIEPAYAQLCEELDGAVSDLLEKRALAEFAGFAGAALRAGQRFAGDYTLAKRRKGVVDFDDLIRKTRDLLAQPGIGDWVKYKLDQSIDHVLVDEAQDTNADQWAIVRHLADEFFESDPDKPSDTPHRTIFAVGDFKQAIFGFQGTDPITFRAARQHFRSHLAERERELRDISLDRSYRSTPPVLELVDEVMSDLGADAIGLDEELHRHLSSAQKSTMPGRVTLLRPVSAETADGADAGEEEWLPDATLLYARKLAQQVKAWLTDPEQRLWLASQGRALRPEDVLILLRSRGEVASLIVARLHEEGVPVAGVDRLMLTEPLAIRDLLAALRFALQPDDDLALASLLVSPLLGWSQDQLYELAFRRKGSLWRALGERKEEFAETHASVSNIIAQADLVTPYRHLENILSGPLQGRRKLLSRLGKEARDPIEELLNAALRFESDHAPSLQRFLDWFDRDSTDIKRDPSAPLDAVRVMTVHGAKGLQAPLVIMADATRNPEYAPIRSLDFAVSEAKQTVPIPPPRKEERFGPLAEAVEAREQKDREEHWRLLYVALTRAEEHLVIGGSLGPRAKGEPPEASWYAAVGGAMERLGGNWLEDDLWSGVRHFDGKEPVQAGARSTPKVRTPVPEIARPEWLHYPAPPEARPPRPLAPSMLGPDDVADPPPSEAMRDAAERGKTLHRLFERLPDVQTAERRDAALRWLEHAAGIGDAEERQKLTDLALLIIEDPAYTDIFGPESLAEAPIAAIVDQVVVSGTADRLLVSDGLIRVIDFKTGSFVPAEAANAPVAHVRQMAAYRDALCVIFPERPIEAALLYTTAPKLLVLPDVLMDAHKPGLPDIEQSLSPSV